MYFVLTEAVTRRFLLELRRYWSFHPKFRDMVRHIQGKYSFKERPQEGIIIKNSSGSQFNLAADNFQGTVHSHITSARVENAPGLFLEWVREDGRAIQRNGGRFPTAPGVYFIEIDEVAEDCSSFTFFIDPLLDVYDETVTMINPTLGRLNAGKFLEGTLRLYLMPGSVQLRENVNYTTDPETGAIMLMNPLNSGDYLSADYRWPATDSTESPAVRPNNEPWHGRPMRALCEPLPGVVMAFGRRVEKGDTMAVIVNRARCPSALEFGGRWDLNLDFDVVARDPQAQREILDQTVTYIWGVLRSRLSTEGIEISTLSLGGETEEVYDETGDDYYYNASFSISIQTDWSLHVPVTAELTRVGPGSIDQEGNRMSLDALAALSDEEIAQINTSLRAVANIRDGVESFGLGLRSFRDPYYKGRSKTFEVIR